MTVGDVEWIFLGVVGVVVVGLDDRYMVRSVGHVHILG